jgi:hypothetical protein
MSGGRSIRSRKAAGSILSGTLHRPSEGGKHGTFELPGSSPPIPDNGYEHRPETMPPEPDRFVAHLDVAFVQQVLDIPKVEREAHVQRVLGRTFPVFA